MQRSIIPKNSHIYIELDCTQTDKGLLTARLSLQKDDPQWDAYLAKTTYGQFYQTSMWAQVRMLDGWQPLIVVVTLDDAIVGGFQILIKSKRHVGKIGLLLKGPVVASDDPIIWNYVIDTLKNTARKNRIKALIIQPADRDKLMPGALAKADFSLNHLEYVVKNNTVVINLQKDEESLFMDIKRTKRQNINTAIRKGVIVREGGREDLRTFFRFMLETCKRQGVSPSPSNEEFLFKLWDIFSSSENVKIFVSEYEGKIITCLIVIPFGDTAYLWKFGWSGEYAKVFPNLIIYWEIFKWAKANGYHFADLGAISKELAETLWNNEHISDELHKTYSYFKVSFGGEVVRLTEGFVYIYNPLIRCAYNAFMPYINSKPSLKKKLVFSND